MLAPMACAHNYFSPVAIDSSLREKVLAPMSLKLPPDCGYGLWAWKARHALPRIVSNLPRTGGTPCLPGFPDNSSIDHQGQCHREHSKLHRRTFPAAPGRGWGDHIGETQVPGRICGGRQ